MATDYSPIYQPGQAISRTTSADVTAGQLLYVSGSDTVAKTSGAGVRQFFASRKEEKGGIIGRVASEDVKSAAVRVAPGNKEAPCHSRNVSPRW